MSPEQKSRVSIDALLQQAGWHVCSLADANIHAARVALRILPQHRLRFADYWLCIAGKATGVIEAKKEGSTLTGVEVQSARYAQQTDIRMLPPKQRHGIPSHEVCDRWRVSHQCLR